MKTIIFTIVLTIGLIILITIHVNKCSSILKNEINKYETKIGDEIILKGDTLMIIDYSFIESNFTLENGKKINIELLNKLVYIKK